MEDSQVQSFFPLLSLTTVWRGANVLALGREVVCEKALISFGRTVLF